MDQDRDHETKPIFGLEEAAQRLLHAVADGAPESLEFAKALADAVLADDTLKRALELERLLESKSPLALVRAVTLAEACLRPSNAKMFGTTSK